MSLGAFTFFTVVNKVEQSKNYSKAFSYLAHGIAKNTCSSMTFFSPETMQMSFSKTA
jgi:hypothetical protein